MRTQLKKFDAAEHRGDGYTSEYNIDWRRAQRKYKQPFFNSHWRVYENNAVRFMSTGSRNLEVRSDFETRTMGTGQLVTHKEAPVLYCGEQKVTKKHTYLQKWHRQPYTTDTDRFWWGDTDIILLDHQYGVAQAVSHSIFLPYDGAQPIVEHPTRFKVYWVNRAMIKLHNERAAFIVSATNAIRALAGDNMVFLRTLRNQIAPEIFTQMCEDFVNGEFGHWDSAMFICAHDKLAAKDNVFLYSMAPCTITNKLYTRPMRLSSHHVKYAGN